VDTLFSVSIIFNSCKQGWKNLGFLRKSFRFIGFLEVFKGFLGFLDFSVEIRPDTIFRPRKDI